MADRERENGCTPWHRKRTKRRISSAVMPHIKWFICYFAFSEILIPSSRCCSAFTANPIIASQSNNLQRMGLGPNKRLNSFIPPKTRCGTATGDENHDDGEINHVSSLCTEAESVSSVSLSRRDAILRTAAISSLILFSAAEKSSAQTLEDLDIGEGRWTSLKDASASTTNNLPIESIVPASFAAYASRFLIVYDNGVSSWWQDLSTKYSLLPDDQMRDKLKKAFASFASSVQLALDQYVSDGEEISASKKKAQGKFESLAMMLLAKYGEKQDAKRQISLLFSTLPRDYQPTETLKKLSLDLDSAPKNADYLPKGQITSFTENLSSLLPPEYNAVYDVSLGAYAIQPTLDLAKLIADNDDSQSAQSTPFGQVASTPLQRDVPNYGPGLYALFGISGGVGCALTHSVVIPLDVVKTRLQTDPDKYNGIFDGATSIVKDEGVGALLLGAQATIAGYLWYGVSVYPSYTFFKRLLGNTVLAPEVATVHANDVALIAGALAAVVASIGLTPLEACRIRTVAEPDVYRSEGLAGTMGIMAREDPNLGWKTLYAGFPSLLTRQVIFGSVKFLAFERACEAIFSYWPELRAATYTSLAVSLVAGGFSGCLSSVVSQPADSVLTYVAQQTGGGGKGSLGVIEGCKIMIEREGPGSLYRGLGSRCLWAGSIIAGQFLLYDVFRTMFGVNRDDLSQVFEVIISNQDSIIS